MDMLKIAGFSIVICAMIVFIGRYKKEYAMLLGIGAGIAIFMFAAGCMGPVTKEIVKLMSGAKVDKNYVSILMKSLGICLVAELASSICRDAGESALAANVEFAGKIAVLLISLPLFGQVANLALSLMSS